MSAPHRYFHSTLRKARSSLFWPPTPEFSEAGLSQRHEKGGRPLYIAIGGRLQYAPEQENGEGPVVIAGWGLGNDARPLNGIFAVAAPAKTQLQTLQTLQTLRTVVAF
jgi:hypothetical protein